MKNIRTDLALEMKEMHDEQNQYDIPGVKIENDEKDDIKISRIQVLSPIGEERMGKPQGNYITLEIPRLKDRDPEYEGTVSMQLAEEIRKLTKLQKNSTTLVVGLGNWNITPDSLGPKVVDKVMVTRHVLELIPEQVDERVRPVCAISPGVLGITGIETGEIIKAIAEKIKPDLIIAIDALASRSTERIGTTIQIADTGINPGSGIGNKRMGISKETLGTPTVAIGVPTVVYAHTIGRDALDLLIHEFSSQATPGSEFYKMLQNLDEGQMDALVGEVLAKGLGDLVVTPKEMDLFIGDISRVISDAINLALHENITLEEVDEYMH